MPAAAVGPTGGEGSASAEAHVLVPAQVLPEGLTDRFEEFGRAAGKVVFGHQTEIRSTMLRLTDRLRRS